MNNFLIESTLILGGLYTLYHFFLKKFKLLHFNRFYILVIGILAVGLPFVNVELTKVPFESLTSSSSNLPIIQTYKEFANTPSTTIHWISLIYWTGLSIAFIRLVIRLVYLSNKFKSKSQNYFGFRILRSESNSVSSFFNLLFVPDSFDIESTENRMILEHERIHQKELHSIDVLFAHLMQCIFWFNPFIYLLTKELKLQHEYIADHLVASQKGNSNYQNELIISALGGTNLVLANAYKTHPIEKRINMLNQQTHTKMNKVRTYLTISLTCLTVVLASFNYSYSADINNHQTQEVTKDKFLEGKVTDADGKPLSMVIIKIKGTKKGVVTNDKGEYKIALKDKDEKIIFSKKGYKKQEIKMQNFSLLNVELSKK